MKVRFKVDKDLCIPAMACIVSEPDIYGLDSQGKAEIKELEIDTIKEIAREGEWVEVETDDRGYERILESAKVCPVLAILVEVEVEGEWKRVYPT